MLDSQSTKKLAFSNSILRIWDQLVASHWDKGNALKINETQGCLTLGHSNCNLSIFQTDFVTIFFKFSLCGLPFLITAGQGRKMGKRESSKKWMSLLRWFCHNFPPIFYPSYWGLQEINPNSQSSVKLPLFSVFSFTEKQNRWQFHGTLSFNLWHLQYSFLAYINLLLTPASWVWSLTDVSKSASIQKWHIGAPIFSGSLVDWTKVGQTLDMNKYWTFTKIGQSTCLIGQNVDKMYTWTKVGQTLDMDKCWTNIGHCSETSVNIYVWTQIGQELDIYLSSFCPTSKYLDAPI